MSHSSMLISNQFNLFTVSLCDKLMLVVCQLRVYLFSFNGYDLYFYPGVFSVFPRYLQLHIQGVEAVEIII